MHHGDDEAGSFFRIGVAADAVQDHGGFEKCVAGFEGLQRTIADLKFEGAFDDVTGDRTGVPMRGAACERIEGDFAHRGRHTFAVLLQFEFIRAQHFDVDLRFCCACCKRECSKAADADEEQDG